MKYMDNDQFILLVAKHLFILSSLMLFKERYIVDVEWFPDWGLVPMFNGP